MGKIAFFYNFLFIKIFYYYRRAVERADKFSQQLPRLGTDTQKKYVFFLENMW